MGTVLFFMPREGEHMKEQEYKPRNKQIHLKVSEEDLNLIRDRMEQTGIRNMSQYIRKMAIDGYFVQVDFHELYELIHLMSISSNNINQIAKVANTYGTIDEKVIVDMKAEHEKVLKLLREYFGKLLETLY